MAQVFLQRLIVGCLSIKFSVVTQRCSSPSSQNPIIWLNIKPVVFFETSHTVYVWLILILHSHLCLGPSVVFFSLCFTTNIVSVFLVFMPCLFQSPLLSRSNKTKRAHVDALLLCNLPYYFTCQVQIIPSVLRFSNIFNLCFHIRIKYQVAHTYKTRSVIMTNHFSTSFWKADEKTKYSALNGV